MRITVILLLNLIIGPFCINNCYAQGVGKEGNRVVGIVSYADRTPLHAGEVTVGIFRREVSIKDYANEDGVFCIVIPKDVRVFQLVYRATGYWAYLTPEPITSAKDPIKVNKVSLRKKDPNDRAQLEMIGNLLRTELAIYRGTSSLALKKAMREELINLSDSIEIPPPDDIRGMTQQERERRIIARSNIDMVVVQMKWQTNQ